MSQRGGFCAAAAVALLLVSGRAAAQQHLPGLHGEAVAFDQARSTLVVFGGSDPDMRHFQGTWGWDGQRWSQLADSAASPTPRSSATMAYNPATREVMLYGGYPAVPPRTRSVPTCDTWTFNGQRWAQVAADACPPDFRPRSISLVFDHRSRQMLLLDGPALPGDTALRSLRIWRWNGQSWQLSDSTGPRRRGFSQVAFDEARRVLVVPVLYGGPDAGVWEWDNGEWLHANETDPGIRQTYGLAFDGSRGRVVLAGGQGSSRGPYFNDTWSWTGSAWHQLLPPTGSTPTGRGGASLHNDPGNRQLIWFGGYDENGSKAELWVLGQRGWSAR